jgi:hypothetical protein
MPAKNLESDYNRILDKGRSTDPMIAGSPSGNPTLCGVLRLVPESLTDEEFEHFDFDPIRESGIAPSGILPVPRSFPSSIDSPRVMRSGHSRGKLRLVMNEVSSGQYDKMVVFENLMHLEQGSADFNAAYIELRLRLIDRVRRPTPVHSQLVHPADQIALSAPEFCRWNVNCARDLFVLGGPWPLLLVLIQLGVAFYSSGWIRMIPATQFIQNYTISDYIGSPYPWTWLSVFSGMLVAYGFANFTVYRRFLELPIFRWAMPAVYLTVVSVLPAVVVLFLKAVKLGG